ncbi:TonB-dependent receptor [Gilvimarinus sp. SDUM040013]|uniref:TonB-dependent receptor n=1 Tax=Gilvimarinus gilvus TaxID=3058038 RepID=A0ABU4S2G9_9GAMM|nr:TonB-dependent receptor [Gilvimarinus sp. SDUM040013]MDO3386895.1 TonB-dependent receptor [Gilvimarinus sp. SDUM040013]MDX6851338.1 TonB-dependent receptor [Gilvimarinus sp. SDUM040013]
MLKRSLLTLGCLVLPAWASADTIQGVVLDDIGQPVGDATVQVVGTRTRTLTDADGNFTLDDLSSDDVELHVRAPRYMHKNVHVHGGSNSLTITLDETVMEVVDVTGLPWHVSQLESATPVTVLSGDALRDQQAATLGDTLAKQVGVHSSYYGPVAGTPVIRGLSGPRVLVAQNGLDVGDVSRSGPDHAVTGEATTARQVEILRGPATLFYGNGAIGGVVNVVDDRVPQDAETFGQLQLEYNGANSEPVVQGSANVGAGDFAFHVDGFWRDADDLEVPEYAELNPDDDATYGVLENSAYDSQGATFGGSYLSDNGFTGISIGRLERNYGIPGHSHDGISVQAELEQDRVQLVSEYSFDDSPLSEARFRYGYTDYQHQEVEGDAIGTIFATELHEARLDLFHQPLAEWRGAVSLHGKREESWARGEEAFTPPATTESIAAAVMEERHFGDWLVQLGGRLELIQIDATDVLLDSEGERGVYRTEHEFTPYSLSAGTVWDFAEGYNLGLSVSHSQRSPSAAEALSFGPHIGAGTFEVGALFDIASNEHGDWVVNFSEQPLELETANNIDISLRKFSGDIGFVIGAFYNQIDDFYYERATGLFAESGHDHDHEEDEHDHEEDEHDHEEVGHDEHEDEALPVYQYTSADTELYGLEGEVHWQVSDPLTLRFTADYIRATLKDGGNLPRIPPLRMGMRAEYEQGPWLLSASATHYFEADNTAELETSTDAYTWVDAEVSYTLPVLDGAKLFLRGDNLLNETARVHSSFIKDIAPRAARSASAGIRVSF